MLYHAFAVCTALSAEIFTCFGRGQGRSHPLKRKVLNSRCKTRTPLAGLARMSLKYSGLRVAFIACYLFFFAVVTEGQEDFYAVCPWEEEIDSWEIQAIVDTAKFSGGNSLSVESVEFVSYRDRATDLLYDFLKYASGAVTVRDPENPEEEVFKEKSWFLTCEDGRPFQNDANTSPPYRRSCYVRARSTKKVNTVTLSELQLSEEVEESATIKVKDVNLSSFHIPDKTKALKERLECDVHAKYHALTYKQKAKDLSNGAVFEKYWQVLELFPFAAEVFLLPNQTRLPERKTYFTYRLEWEAFQPGDIEMDCGLDLRFENEQSLKSAAAPYYGEFSCKIKKHDVDVRLIQSAYTVLSLVFQKYRAMSKFVEPVLEANGTLFYI